MRVIKDVKSLTEWKLNHRDAGRAWTLVPTMGNLHEGHLALMRQAFTRTDSVIASIYVNPTQFGLNEDFANYPRTPQDDIDKLEELGVEAVFMPDDELIYPYGKDDAIGYTLPSRYTDILCGAQRPGHFHGVVAVVSRLFHLVEPKHAVFGAKDYQQQWIIRRMVDDLHFPVDVVSGDTVRAADGLALSSRNQYLSDAERKLAPLLYKVMQRCRELIEQGKSVAAVLERAQAILRDKGFAPEYLELRKQADLSIADNASSPVVLLAAACLGKTRLIDNLIFGEA